MLWRACPRDGTLVGSEHYESALSARLQDTGDTRETPAIDVCHGLISDGADLCVYDPQVSKDQIYRYICSHFLSCLPSSVLKLACVCRLAQEAPCHMFEAIDNR